MLEDDVDWDIRLRSAQIPLAASAIRQILPSPPPRRSFHSFAHFGTNHTPYWGDHGAWDLLYLGHCGDYFEEVDEEGPRLEKHYNLTTMPHIQYKDPTLPSPSDLHPFTQTLFDKLSMPAHTRVFHRSKFPLCSFGYAITRPAAERLLDDLAPPKLKKGGPRAFDVALLNACREQKTIQYPIPTQSCDTSIPAPDCAAGHSTPNSSIICPGTVSSMRLAPKWAKGLVFLLST
jgi:hypothetical protein